MMYDHYSDLFVFEMTEEQWKDRWPNFSAKELSCKCCGEYYHDPAYLDKLQAARTNAGEAFKINSGHRCKKHNHLVGGAKNSEHLRIATDIHTPRKKRRKFLKALFDAGITTFGLYSTFIHADPRPWRLWIMGEKRIWSTIYDEVVKRDD